MPRFEKLNKKGLVVLPKELRNTIIYEVITGSISYGVADTAQHSDTDIVAVCIPSKANIFPHLNGQIPGFGKQTKQFTTWQEHHIFDNDSGIEYDLTAYGIVKFFSLCFGNNPNLIDVLFSPRNCITYTTQVGEHIRKHRHLFLSRQAYKKYVHYAYSQLHKMRINNPEGLDEVKSFEEKYTIDPKTTLSHVEEELKSRDLI